MTGSRCGAGHKRDTDGIRHAGVQVKGFDLFMSILRHVKVSIPTKWQEGCIRIKEWIESYARTVDNPIIVEIADEADGGSIWITSPLESVDLSGSGLRGEFDAANIAVGILNDHLGQPSKNPSQGRKDVREATGDAEEELKQGLEEIARIFRKPPSK